ncbi:hypothetical protein OIE66_41725 [Nonomuraea sp. NBC_01738]|uniref:hypothetical protein n=1 Tax=Nonomuraea sp. NBC_01738 TaxID=2976003 RepID=UPI002E0FBC0C|nr:hypothetical protein OIE66_41725 [Nonomuraea sp. NBC_01738]
MDYPDDPIAKIYPVYLATADVIGELRAMGASGWEVSDDIRLDPSIDYTTFHPDRPLPNFLWLKVVDHAHADDLGLDEIRKLWVSQRVLDTLLRLGMKHAELDGERITPPPHRRQRAPAPSPQ